MEITYTRVGDYLIPDIVLSDPLPELAEGLGRYGRMHKAYLREHRPILYNRLLLSERLYPLCREIDKTANERHNRGVSEEVILNELIYN